MPLCQVNIVRGTLDRPGETTERLRAALTGLAPGAPVIVLIHGYKFTPRRAAHNPHTHILSLEPRPCWKAVSWPRRLGLGAAGGPEPLCIALGWEARGTLWQAYGRAAEAGAGLAELIAAVRAARPGAEVQVLAHSLGARVALAALPHLEPGAMGRAVLLAAAETRGRAACWLAGPAGRAVEIVNVTSRENAVFDGLLEWLVAPHRWGERALGRGLGGRDPRWVDLAIDDDRVRAALAALGYAIPAPDRRVCHWSVYLRSGLFDVYRAVLSGALPLDRLRAALPVPAMDGPDRPGPFALPPLPLPRGETS
jgi:pimeloyl-ACP methyl ester carboxylesterase